MKAICFRITLALTVLTLTELVAARPHVAQGTLLWQQNLIGTATGFNFNAAHSVAVDKHGNVVAAGTTVNAGVDTGNYFDFTVAKFDHDGTLLWQQTLNRSATGNSYGGEALSVAVDNQGNVVAAGSTENTGAFLDFTVAKFDGDGTLLWQRAINGTANGFDVAYSVAVDSQGNVVAAGFTENTGTFGDFTVAKFDRDGTLLWQRTLIGTAANSNGLALSVAVDTQGHVVAAGYTENAGTGNDFTVAKFDRDGTLLWQQTLNGTANDFDAAVSVAVDNQENVVTAGLTENTGNYFDFTVVKFDGDGILLWQQTLNGTAVNSFDQALSVTVDSQGNVVAAGDTQNTGTNFDFTVAKFDRDGALLWHQTLNGTANGFDQALSVAVDNQGNVVAAGDTQNTGTDFDFTVAKFDRDGTLLWQRTLNATANSFDEASSMAVDNQGNVVAAGRKVTGTSQAFTVAKFDR